MAIVLAVSSTLHADDVNRDTPCGTTGESPPAVQNDPFRDDMSAAREGGNTDVSPPRETTPNGNYAKRGTGLASLFDWAAQAWRQAREHERREQRERRRLQLYHHRNAAGLATDATDAAQWRVDQLGMPLAMPYIGNNTPTLGQTAALASGLANLKRNMVPANAANSSNADGQLPDVFYGGRTLDEARWFREHGYIRRGNEWVRICDPDAGGDPDTVNGPANTDTTPPTPHDAGRHPARHDANPPSATNRSAAPQRAVWVLRWRPQPPREEEGLSLRSLVPEPFRELVDEGLSLLKAAGFTAAHQLNVVFCGSDSLAADAERAQLEAGLTRSARGRWNRVARFSAGVTFAYLQSLLDRPARPRQVKEESPFWAGVEEFFSWDTQAGSFKAGGLALADSLTLHLSDRLGEATEKAQKEMGMTREQRELHGGTSDATAFVIHCLAGGQGGTAVLKHPVRQALRFGSPGRARVLAEGGTILGAGAAGHLHLGGRALGSGDGLRANEHLTHATMLLGGPGGQPIRVPSGAFTYGGQRTSIVHEADRATGQTRRTRPQPPPPPVPTRGSSTPPRTVTPRANAPAAPAPGTNAPAAPTPPRVAGVRVATPSGLTPVRQQEVSNTCGVATVQIAVERATGRQVSQQDLVRAAILSGEGYRVGLDLVNGRTPGGTWPHGLIAMLRSQGLRVRVPFGRTFPRDGLDPTGPAVDANAAPLAGNPRVTLSHAARELRQGNQVLAVVRYQSDRPDTPHWVAIEKVASGRVTVGGRAVINGPYVIIGDPARGTSVAMSRADFERHWQPQATVIVERPQVAQPPSQPVGPPLPTSARPRIPSAETSSAPRAQPTIEPPRRSPDAGPQSN